MNRELKKLSLTKDTLKKLVSPELVKVRGGAMRFVTTDIHTVNPATCMCWCTIQLTAQCICEP